jgi:hypothetical protein
LATNHTAAKVMQEAGATRVAVGGPAIAAAVAVAQVILGSLNVVLPGALLGEITPEIAAAIVSAQAKKVLLPVNRAQVEIVGSDDQTLDRLIAQSLHRAQVLVTEGTKR